MMLSNQLAIEHRMIVALFDGLHKPGGEYANRKKDWEQRVMEKLDAKMDLLKDSRHEREREKWDDVFYTS